MIRRYSKLVGADIYRDRGSFDAKLLDGSFETLWLQPDIRPRLRASCRQRQRRDLIPAWGQRPRKQGAKIDEG